MKYELRPHALQNGFTHAIHLAEGNQKLIAEVRGESYARLIASAPELLEALITAQWMLERDYIDEQKMGVIEKCRAAIDKAKSENSA